MHDHGSQWSTRESCSIPGEDILPSHSGLAARIGQNSLRFRPFFYDRHTEGMDNNGGAATATVNSQHVGFILAVRVRHGYG